MTAPARRISHFGVGKALMTVSAVWGGVGSYVFDWNETHLFNPSWPPHARFHDAQTMSMGVALAGATAYSLWRRTSDPEGALNDGLVAGTIFWLTQFSVALYPGTKSADPPAPDDWRQLRGAIPSLALTVAGYALERRRLARS